jgi:hypothetical protein
MDNNLSDRISLLHIRRDALETFKHIDSLEVKLAESVGVITDIKSILDRGNVYLEETNTIRLHDRILMLKEQAIDIMAMLNAAHIDLTRKAGS